MDLLVETQLPDKGVAVVNLTGEVDFYSCPMLKRILLELLDTGVNWLVVNLNRVEYLDSEGISVLGEVFRRVREQGGDLKIVCENPRLRRIFELIHLHRVIGFCATEAEALEQHVSR